MNDDDVDRQYRARHTELVALAARVQAHVAGHLAGLPRIDRITARAKDPARFLDKARATAGDGSRKYAHPLEQIQDQVGARVVVFYLSDVEPAIAAIDRYYRRIEMQHVVPESPSEFGYVGRHLILALPEDLVASDDDRRRLPRFFELQVRTLFQHAWSEAEHDISYKAKGPLTIEQRRHVAFTAAQAWGADQFFDLLASELAPQAQAVPLVSAAGITPNGAMT